MLSSHHVTCRRTQERANVWDKSEIGHQARPDQTRAEQSRPEHYTVQEIYRDDKKEEADRVGVSVVEIHQSVFRLHRSGVDLREKFTFAWIKNILIKKRVRMKTMWGQMIAGRKHYIGQSKCAQKREDRHYSRLKFNQTKLNFCQVNVQKKRMFWKWNYTRSIFLHIVGNSGERNRLVEKINQAKREINFIFILGRGARGA